MFAPHPPTKSPGYGPAIYHHMEQYMHLFIYTLYITGISVGVIVTISCLVFLECFDVLFC